MDYLKDLKADHGNTAPLRGRGDPSAGERIVRDIIPPAIARRPLRFLKRSAPSGPPPERPRPHARREPPRGRKARPAAERETMDVLSRETLPGGALDASRGHAGPGRPPSEAGAAEASIPVRTWEPDAMRRGRIRRTLILSGLGTVLALALILPTFVFPSYTLTLRPSPVSVPVEVGITADTERINPDLGAMRIPALLVSAEERMSQEYEATGKKFVSEKARGEVLIFNAYSSSPQTLVASTRLQAPSGKIYRLGDTITLPGAKVEEGKIIPTSLAATAVADEPGEAANSGPAEFRIPGFRGSPKYQGFYAKAERGFSGGFVGEARIVTAEDLRASSEDLTRRIVAKLRDKLKTSSPPAEDFLVPDGGREVVIVSIESPEAGARRDRYPVTVTARGRLMAVRSSHLAETIAARSAPPPRPGLTRKVPSTQPELALRDARFGPGAGELTFTANGKLRYYQEPDLGELTATLRASTPEKAEAYLKGRPEIESFRAKRFPAWLWFIPQRPGGFRVLVEPPA